MVDARARVGGGAQQQQEQVQPFVALFCSRPVCFGCSLSCGWVDTCGRNLRVFLHSCNMYFFVICRRISSLQIPTLCRWQPVCSSWWWWAETSASACHAPQILGIRLCRERKHMNRERDKYWIGNTCAHCVEEPGSMCFENQVIPGCISIRQLSMYENKYKRKAGANTVAGQSGPIWVP